MIDESQIEEVSDSLEVLGGARADGPSDDDMLNPSYLRGMIL